MAGMGRTGSTVPAVHTIPRQFRTCNGLEVLLLRLWHSKDLYRVPGPPIFEDYWSFEELPHPCLMDKSVPCDGSRQSGRRFHFLLGEVLRSQSRVRVDGGRGGDGDGGGGERDPPDFLAQVVAKLV